MPPRRSPRAPVALLDIAGFAPRAARLVAGVDEAGRGCLAGPVVAGAVILPREYDLPGLGDSKALTEARRNELAPKIRACAIAWGLGVIWPPEIDRRNILQATFHAMSRAVCALRTAPELLVIDGNKTVPPAVLDAHWRRGHAGELPRQECLVKGDTLMPAISAASILAKTYRDQLMRALDRRWPGYGFSAHKGYGTREHLRRIQELGPCPQHRMTFAGVKPAAAPVQGLLC